MSLRTSGLQDSKHYKIGRGRLYFSDVDANGLPEGGWEDLGNVNSFGINVSSEELTHKSSREGLSTTDARVVISQDVSISFNGDSIFLENLSRWLSGDNQDDAQAATAVTGSGNMEIVNRGRWYDLYTNPGSYPGTPETRAYLPTSVVVEPSGGGTPYTLGTDYLLDDKMGRIFIPETSTIPAGTVGSPTVLDIDFTPTATILERIHAFTKGQISGAMKFVAVDPRNDSKETEFQFHYVTLSPDGELGLISDDWQGLGFTGVAEKREAVSANSPTLTVTYPQQ